MSSEWCLQLSQDAVQLPFHAEVAPSRLVLLVPSLNLPPIGLHHGLVPHVNGGVSPPMLQVIGEWLALGSDSVNQSGIVVLGCVFVDPRLAFFWIVDRRLEDLPVAKKAIVHAVCALGLAPQCQELPRPSRKVRWKLLLGFVNRDVGVASTSH